jgi:type IV pilus assembly protein PilF
VISKTKLLLASVVIILMSGCVTSSSGAPEPEKADPEVSAQRFFQLGVQYYRNGSYELARDRLITTLEYDPKLAIAHSTLALTYVQLENPRLAKEHFEKAVKYGPDNFDVRNAYAVYLCQQKDFDNARVQFDRAIDVYENDNSEIMLTNAGVCMSSKPDYELAEEYFREAIAQKPRYGEALIQLASLKHNTGENLHARAFLQRYLITNEPSASVLFLGVKIEKALGDDRAATDYTNQLLRDFPDSAESNFIRNNR